MDLSHHQLYRHHYEQQHQEAAAPAATTYDTSQSQHDLHYAHHYYDYSLPQPYPHLDLDPSASYSSQIRRPGINTPSTLAALSQLSEFAGTMDAAGRSAMAGGGPLPPMQHPHYHHYYSQHYSTEHGPVAVQPGGSSGGGGRRGRGTFRGSGRRRGGPFKGNGGGRVNLNYRAPKKDGEAPVPFGGRGGRGRMGRGRGRKQDQSGAGLQSTHVATAIVAEQSAVPDGGKQQTMTEEPPVPVPSLHPLLPIAWCDICRVDCNSLQILEQHKNGKRHKRTVQKLEEIQRQQKLFAELQAKAMPNTMLTSAVMEKSVTPGTIATAAVVSDQAGDATKASTTTDNNPDIVVSATQLDDVSKPYNVALTLQQDIEAKADNAQTAEDQLAPAMLGGATEVAHSAASVAEEQPTEGSKGPPSSDGQNNADRRCGGIKRKMTKSGRGGKRPKGSDPAQGQVPKRPKERPRFCTLCNVMCESLVVFESHVVGKKHTSRIKRSQAEGNVYGPLTVYIPPNQTSVHPVQGLDPLFYGLKSQEMLQQESYLGQNGQQVENSSFHQGGQGEQHMNAEGVVSGLPVLERLQHSESDVVSANRDKEVASRDNAETQEAAPAASNLESKEPPPSPLGRETTSSEPEAAVSVQEFGTVPGGDNVPTGQNDKTEKPRT